MQNEGGKLRPDWEFKLQDLTEVVNTGVICQTRSLRKESLDNLWGRQMFCTWESGFKVLLALQGYRKEINVKGLLDLGHFSFSCPATPVQLLPLLCCSKDKHRSGEDSSGRRAEPNEVSVQTHWKQEKKASYVREESELICHCAAIR